MTTFQSALSVFFRSGGLNLILYIALAAIFLFCLAKCVAPLTASRHALTRAIRALRKGEKAKRNWKDEGFLGTQMQAGWSSYLKNQEFMETEFGGSAKVTDFVGEDDVCPPERNQLADSAPGILMSVGIFGTLIGLWQGLSGEEVSLPLLIPAVRQALAPSIVGSALALLFSLIHRASISSALGALGDFSDAMARFIGKPAVNPLAKSAQAQKEQAAQIKALSEDVTDRLADRFSQSMMKALEPMTDSIDQFTKTAANEHVRGVDALVSRFVGLLDERMGGGMEKMSATIDALCKSHEQMQKDLREASDGMARVSGNIAEAHHLSQDMIEKFDGYITRLGGAQAMVDEGYARIAANVEHLEIVARQQNNYLLSVGKLQSEWTRALTAFQTAADQFARVSTENTQQAGQALSRAAEELKRSSDALVESQYALAGGVTKEIEKAYASFFQNAGKTSDQLNWLMENIKATLSRLPDLLDDTAAIYAGQADRLNDALHAAQAALEDAADRIGAYGGR